MKALALGLLLLLPGVAFAAEPRKMGTFTIGEFRAWPESVQFGYVTGWWEHSALLSVTCVRPILTAERVAALKYDPRLTPTDLLSRAMLALEIRDGCTVEK